MLYPPLTPYNGRTDPDHYALPQPTRGQRDMPLKTACLLKQWMESLSWDYCQSCHSLYPLQLLPPHLRSSKPTRAHVCVCTASTYIVPQAHLIPEVLTCLTWDDNAILSPFTVDCGPFQHRLHGYRCKTGLCKLVTKKQSVLDTITSLSSHTQQDRCLAAYQYLMTSSESSYKDFIRIAADLTSQNKDPSIFDIFTWVGIECALWPCLFPYTSWCESSLTSETIKQSSKASFLVKCFSPVIDYSLHFDLMQFSFDRWLYKTITGAIHSSRKFHGQVSQYQILSALDSKPFSTEYWKWQHRYLIDAVRQFGFPTLFITISPYEWSYTRPVWLQDIITRNNLPPHVVAFYLNFHFLHSLEQIIRGYMCGGNNSKWKDHLFKDTSPTAGAKNVLTYFYRFEFQERGTLHVHLLVWLSDLTHLQHQRIRGDLPHIDSYLHPYVQRFQTSHTSSLPIHDNVTNVVRTQSGPKLQISHPDNAFAIGLRAYIDTVLPALQCSMDVQVANDNSLILQYVAGYVSKWKESFHADSIFTAQAPPALTAFRYIASLSICEPEMWMLLTSKKLSWCDSTRTQFRVPDASHAATHTVVLQYYARSHDCESMSLHQYLREYNVAVTPPKRYKAGTSVLVGVQYLSIYNPMYFFQLLLMTYPHRDIADITPSSDDSPPQIKYFKLASIHLPHVVNNIKKFEDELHACGHKIGFIKTAGCYLQSLQDILYLHQRAALPQMTIHPYTTSYSDTAPLSTTQEHAFACFKRLLDQRTEYYSHTSTVTQEWMQFIMLSGKPGSGKSYLLLMCIHHALATGCSVVVAAPTGILAQTFAESLHDEVHCDTLHSLFFFSETSETCSYNWALNKYDVICIDEISQVSVPLFHHILLTLSKLFVRPLILLSGDFAQQQPLGTVNSRTTTLPNILSDRAIMDNIIRFNLSSQFRCADNELMAFLDIIRVRTPTASELDNIMDGRVLLSDLSTERDVCRELKKFPAHIVLTMTNKGAHYINIQTIQTAFKDKACLGTLTLDNGHDYPLYRDMTVMLTRNCNKALGFVNGQFATVITIQRQSIIVKTAKGHLLTVHPITEVTAEETRTYHPCIPAYACTIAKAQGQTLDNVILWFDRPTLPPGTAYVAMSRVRTLQNVKFLYPVTCSHFQHMTLQ